MKIFTFALALILTTTILSLTILKNNMMFVEAWWCTGHMLTAQIALNNVNDHVRAVTNRHFEYLAQIGPFPMANDAVAGACWPDDVKGYGLRAMDEWHFEDIPYNPENIETPKDWCPIQNDNAASTLSGFYNAGKKKGQNGFSASFALAYLIHNYGDLHQPLHCITYIAPEFPTGDRGGNSIKMKWQNNTVNLHAFWDSICMQPHYADHDRPLNATAKNWLNEVAKKLNNTWNNISHYEGSLYDGNVIASHSNQLAIDKVYANVTGPNNLTADGVLPQWYQDRCIPAAERQIVLGGMRLAHTLTNMFKDAEMPQLLKIEEHTPLGFGAKETGIFFGGFATAFFVVAFGYIFFCKKDDTKQDRNGGNDQDKQPLVSNDFNEVGSGAPAPGGSTSGYHHKTDGGHVSSEDVRNSLYSDHKA